MVKNVHVPDPPVDFMPYTGKGSLNGYFTKDTKPFYERRLFGLFDAQQGILAGGLASASLRQARD